MDDSQIVINTLSFSQELLTSFLGSLFAFIFAFALFYLTERFRDNKINQNLSKSLQREFDYNIKLIEDQKRELDKLLRSISANKKEFKFFKFDKFLSKFIKETFNSGVIFDYLSAEEIGDLDVIISFFSQSTSQIYFQYQSEFNSDKIDQATALGRFEFLNDTLEKHLAGLKKFKEKLRRLGK